MLAAIALAAGAALAQVPDRLPGLTVESAEAADDPGTGEPVVVVTFGPEDVERLSRFTAAHLGRTVAVRMDGETISRFSVTAPLVNPVRLAGPFTRDESYAVATRLAEGTGIELVAGGN